MFLLLKLIPVLKTNKKQAKLFSDATIIYLANFFSVNWFKGLNKGVINHKQFQIDNNINGNLSVTWTSVNQH